MPEFDKPIGRVLRRLRLQRFLAAAVWSLAAALVLAAALIAAERLTAGRAFPGPAWAAPATAVGLGLVAAIVVAVATGPSRLEAAAAIDRAFGLHERVGTALSLPDYLKDTPAGRALMADARRHLDGLDLAAAFRPKVPRLAWVPLLPAALALGLWFVPESLVAQARAAGKPKPLALNKEAFAKKLEAIQQGVQAAKKDAEKNKAEEAAKALAELEKAVQALAKAPPDDKDKARIELNKIADALKERQKQFGSSEQIKNQLRLLDAKAMGGPADELARDLARGDFAKAAEEVKKLQDKLASGQLTDAEKKQLQQQIEQMQQKLQSMASLDQRQKALDQALKEGKIGQKQYEQQKAALQEQAKEMQKLAQLAKQLGEAGKQMSQGDLKKAAEALGMSQQQLEQMAKDAQSLESLDQALADLQDAKGEGPGDGKNQLGEGPDGGMTGMNRPGTGNGLGRGRGQGDRPEAPEETRSYSALTKQQYGKGKAVVHGLADAPKQARGESLLEVQENIEASSQAAAEAISNQRIPADVKKHVLGYFDQIRKGE